MVTRKCTKCGEIKDIEEFHKKQHMCKICKREHDRNYRENNKESIRLMKITYYNANKPKINEYRKQQHLNNKEEDNNRSKIYREQNKDVLKLKAKEYEKNPIRKEKKLKYYHNRRTRYNNTPCTLTLLQWEKILKSQNNKCAMCGKRFCKSRKPEKDHIIPLSRGGGLTFENVQALCHSCNSSKNASLDHTKLVTWGIFS
jgi:hypothetical protein